MPVAADATPPRTWRAAIAALAIASSTMFTIPYSTQAIIPEIGRGLGAGPALAGLTITVVVIGIAVGAWVLGPLSDRRGRRVVMVWSCAALVVPTAAIALVHDTAQLLVLRAAQGLLLPGLLTVAAVYIYEVFPAERVPTVVGFYTSGLVLGGFLGRTIPALLVDHVGWRASLAVLAVPVAVSAVLIRVLLPEAPPLPQARAPLHALRAHLGNRPLLLNAFAAGTTFFAFVGLFSVLAYRLESPVFGLRQAQIGAVYVVWLVGALLPVATRIAGRVGPRRVLPVFPVVAAVGIGLACTASLPVTAVGLMVTAGSLFFMVGIAQLLVPQLADRDRASAMSVHLTIYYLIGSLGPFALGAAWDAAGWAGAVGCALGALALALALALLLRRTAPAAGPPEGVSDPLLS